MTRLPLHRRQAGLTLVELMISMVIGMIIVLAVITAYISASRAVRVAEATGRMNEDAQAALTILTQQLRMAGANPAQPDRNTTTLHNVLANPFSIRGCDTTFSNITTATPTAASLTCPSGTGNSSISIGYEANRFNTVPTSGGTPTDCLGNSLPPTSSVSPQAVTTSLGVSATVTVYEAENRFYIGTSTYIASPSLYCKGNSPNTNPQPLVENIEAMRITYGMSNPARARDFGVNSPGVAPNFILGYLSTSQMLTSSVSLSGSLTFTVPNLTTSVGYLTPSFSLSQMAVTPTTAFINPATGAAISNLPTGVPESKIWGAVKAVRVCVLVRSEGRVFDQWKEGNTERPAKYVNCDGLLVDSADGRLRRAYTTTVVLRNQSP